MFVIAKMKHDHLLDFVLLTDCHYLSWKNPGKSGEDDAAWHARLGCIYKEKYGEDFRFLTCYFFLHNKPKFLTLTSEGNSSPDDPEEAFKKRSIGGKDERPIGNNQAKHLK